MAAPEASDYLHITLLDKLNRDGAFRRRDEAAD
jgi:hypothetical protein